MQRYKTESGFTLVETLVAITILLIVIVGPMTAAHKGIQNAIHAREQLVAVHLAQEAIEQAFNLRDEYALRADAGSESDTWAFVDTLPSDCFDADIGCGFDVEAREFASCSSLNGCVLYQDSSDEDTYYSYDSSGDVSLFTRKIYMSEVSECQELSVRAVVEWRSPSISGVQDVSSETRIFNQYSEYAAAACGG